MSKTNKNIHKFKRSMALAFDENISDRTIGQYARAGHLVVLVANHGVPDEIWVEDAYLKGAEIVFSYDTDVGNIIQQYNYEGMGWRVP